MNTYSIVIPAYNEEGAIGLVLDEILASPLASRMEVIVVDDGSRDETVREASERNVSVLPSVSNFGYGYSLKRGIRAAKHDHIIILDADGSYPVAELPRLVAEYEKGFDMVVGARQGTFYHGTRTKRIARFFFRTLSEFATGRTIPDINSGYRVFRRDRAMGFFHTLSSGFSFTTTITLAFMLNALSVRYIPVEYHKRTGRSKVRYWRDTIRSLQIIIEAIIFYNPIKIFLLCAEGVVISGVLGILTGLLFAPWIGLIVASSLSMSILVFSVGCIGVFLKFMNSSRHIS